MKNLKKVSFKKSLKVTKAIIVLITMVVILSAAGCENGNNITGSDNIPMYAESYNFYYISIKQFYWLRLGDIPVEIDVDLIKELNISVVDTLEYSFKTGDSILLFHGAIYDYIFIRTSYDFNYNNNMSGKTLYIKINDNIIYTENITGDSGNIYNFHDCILNKNSTNILKIYIN